MAAVPLEMEFPDSSALVRGRYHPEQRMLDLWWRTRPSDRRGRPYEYYGVPASVWEELLAVHAAGESVGEFANGRIKEVYRFNEKRLAG